MTLFDPRLSHLPGAQQAVWPSLRGAQELGFVLYGGTAVALQLGHRISVDFGFFPAGRSPPRRCARRCPC